MKKIFLLASIVLFAFSSNVFAQPISLSSTNITYTTADLNWDATPCPGNVTLNYRVSGTGTWLFVSQATPQTLSGLDCICCPLIVAHSVVKVSIGAQASQPNSNNLKT